MLADLRALAEEIGPRGTGTGGERAAADFVAARLDAMGLDVQRRTFYAVASQNAFPLAIDALALAAVILYTLQRTLSWEPGRWIAALLAMATAPLLWQTIRSAGNPLRPFLPKVRSQNVVARLPCAGDIQGRAVVVAHLDTNRCRIAWQTGMVNRLQPLTGLTLAMLGLLGLLYLAGSLFGGPPWVEWASLLPAAYVVGTMITLWKDDRTPFSHGAHDDAAGVAVALEIARRLRVEPLQHTEVWLALVGAEETDHSGIHALLREHRALIGRTSVPGAAFIVLEGVGSGQLVYLTQQGVCTHYAPDPHLLEAARHVAAQHPELDAQPAQMVMEDDTGTLRRSGYRAICIAGLDPETGSLPLWHRPDDTAGAVSAEFMAGVVVFVEALLNRLDSVQRW